MLRHCRPWHCAPVAVAHFVGVFLFYFFVGAQIYSRRESTPFLLVAARDLFPSQLALCALFDLPVVNGLSPSEAAGARPPGPPHGQAPHPHAPRQLSTRDLLSLSLAASATTPTGRVATARVAPVGTPLTDGGGHITTNRPYRRVGAGSALVPSISSHCRCPARFSVKMDDERNVFFVPAHTCQGASLSHGRPLRSYGIV